MTGFLLLIFLILLSVYIAREAENKIKKDFQIKISKLKTEIQNNKKQIEILQKIINETNNITVKATAYNAVPEQTDSDPDVTACMSKPTIGSIAVSQDLYFQGWTCGKRVHIKGLGIFTIKDVMDCSNEKLYKCRKLKQVDIVMETIEQALEFGIKKNLNAVLLSHYEKM